MSKDKEFQKKLEGIFRSEAREHRQAILGGLLEIEKGHGGTSRETEVVETIFREAHSLKGAARAVNLVKIEALCQSLESIFSILKKREKRLLPEMYDTLFATIDRIDPKIRRIYLRGYLAARDPQTPIGRRTIHNTIKKIDRV